jgi:dephospho-CoA kinase
MKKVIGVTGTNASGKDTVAEYISKKLGIKKFEMSKPLKDFARARGLELTRENLISLGSEVAEREGLDYLAKIVLEGIQDVGVVAGVRQLPQIEYLKSNAELVLISVDADPYTRFLRSTERQSIIEQETVEDFVQKENEEGSSNIQRHFDCMEAADYKISNDGTLEELEEKVDQILKAEGFID